MSAIKFVKFSNKKFKLTLNPQAALVTGEFVSINPVGDKYNGYYNTINFNKLMSEEDLRRPYHVTVQIQSAHNDAIMTQIRDTAPVMYNIQFNGNSTSTYTPYPSNAPSFCGIVSYSNIINGAQSAVIIDTTPDRNTPFYLPSLVGVNSIFTTFFDALANGVSFGNPNVIIQLTFEAADYEIGP